MASLALTVSLIILAMLGTAPLGILAVKCKYPVFGALLGAVSLFFGLWWLIGIPSAPPLVGLWASLAGAYALYSGARAYR